MEQRLCLKRVKIGTWNKPTRISGFFFFHMTWHTIFYQMIPKLFKKFVGTRKSSKFWKKSRNIYKIITFAGRVWYQ